MEHPIAACDRLAAGVEILNVADDQFGARVHPVLVAERHIVENAHLVALRKQALDEMATDEACSSGDENGFAHGQLSLGRRRGVALEALDVKRRVGQVILVIDSACLDGIIDLDGLDCPAMARKIGHEG